ncbi:MAG: TlpA family protein disulfide reductase, partial [Dehalococcoidia bacterium]
HDAAPAQAAAVQGLAVGTPAPVLRLPDLDGKPVDLAELRGQETLLLFWNPGCGFCQQLLPQLKEWEASPPPGAPRLLVVSTGDAETNRAHALRATVVLDQSFGVGNAFGANGTPSAVLVDAEGKITAPLAVGGPGVMALARPVTA